MTDPTDPTDPPRPRAPGERRLDRPPSERYRSSGPSPETAPDASTTASSTRGIAFGLAAALAGAAATVVLGGMLAITAGLLVVAAATGYAVAAGVRSGARASLTRTGRLGWSIGLAVAGVALGQVGLWLFARTEGGVLALPDYLAQTFGPLVPIQVAVAALIAWWTAR